MTTPYPGKVCPRPGNPASLRRSTHHKPLPTPHSTQSKSPPPRPRRVAGLTVFRNPGESSSRLGRDPARQRARPHTRHSPVGWVVTQRVQRARPHTRHREVARPVSQAIGLTPPTLAFPYIPFHEPLHLLGFPPPRVTRIASSSHVPRFPSSEPMPIGEPARIPRPRATSARHGILSSENDSNSPQIIEYKK